MKSNRPIYNKNAVFTGIVIFLLFVSFPFMYTMLIGDASGAPELKLTKEAEKAKRCIRSTQYMKAEHMQLLDEWRDTVVRNNKRMYTNLIDKTYEMSLTNTCMECHYNKKDFCDKCHNYASVDPYCWDCHIENPKENE